MAATVALVALVLRWQERGATDTTAVVMVPATALGVLLASCALLLLRSPGPVGKSIGCLAAAATTALGAATAGQYAAEWQSGVAGARLADWGEWWAQRPTPMTGLGLVFIGASLCALGMPRLRPWANLGAAVTLVLSLTGLVGHAYGASELYGLNPWGGTAVSTAVALGGIALGVVFADPSQGVAAVILGDSPGGHLLRRLLPVAVATPLLIGWLALAAQRAQLVDAAFGTALLVVSTIVLLIGYVVRQGKAVHAVHAERERLLARERAAGDRVTNILESITDAFFAVDREWRFTYVNREAERLLRRSREELLGRSIWAEFPESASAAFKAQYQRAVAEQRTVGFEEHYAPLGLWFDVHAFPAADGLSVYFHDVTARKLAEQRLRESEERYRLLADMIPQHIWTTDADGYHNYFSRRWYEYTGTTPEQTRGEGWLAFLHPEDSERTIARWQQSLRTGEPYSVEYRFRGADGNYRWFWGQAMPLRNEAGEVTRWFGTLTDIMERKQAEEATRESEERFRALANSIPQLAWMADATGSIFWYNERWHEYTGASLEEMRGWGWRKVHHPDHVDRVVERIRHAFETGERWEDTFPLRSKTGEYRWFLSRALPITDASGKVVRWFGTNTDVTEQREAAAERERLLGREQEARAEAEWRRAELERMTESRSRLIRGFSHDVRNPLSVANMQVWMLENGKLMGELSEKQRESVERIRRSIRSSLRLIDDLLEVSRAEAGQIDLKPVETDVAEAAREVADDFRAQAVAAGLEMNVRAPQRLEARTDPARLRQVLTNLLSNAVKYTSRGRVTVDAKSEPTGGPKAGDWVAVRVIDTGPGIPNDKWEAIFQEYTRLSPQTHEGAGIGLAISRRIAQLLGGDLTVESEVGRGSVFTLWLPAAPVPQAGRDGAATSERAPGSGQPALQRSG